VLYGELTRRYAADARVNLLQGDEGRIRSSAGGRAARGHTGRNTQRTELLLPYKARVAFALLGGSSSSRAARLCVYIRAPERNAAPAPLAPIPFALYLILRAKSRVRTSRPRRPP
jgi:hypothetical protein